jgi:cold shock CspA family protein
MRFDGKLEKWNDDRGFGFITPSKGGDPVFVHISAFQADGRRPRIGELLSFEVEPDGAGKRRAINVQRPRRSGLVSAGTSSSQRHTRSLRSRLSGGVVVIVLVAVGAYAYTKYTRLESRIAEPIGAPATSNAPYSAMPTSFRCDGRKHCSQMTSCDEAKFFLKNCPGTQMDGDRDGIPCEQQWCTGPGSR